MEVNVDKNKNQIFTLYKCEDGKVFCAKDAQDLVTQMRVDARHYDFEDNYDYMIFCKENTQAWNGVELDISSEESFLKGLVDCGLMNIYMTN